MFPDAERASSGGGFPSELTVVYDDKCPLCRRCRSWVLAQSHLVNFRFVAASEPWVEQWLGSLMPIGDDLVVIDHRGSAWVGPDAFIVCLWGLERYRSLAGKLQRPGARRLAKQAFHSVSAGRGVASLFLGAEGLDDLDRIDAATLGAQPRLPVGGRSETTECDDRSCTT